MTAHKHFKQLVRSRMTKTGESYTSARRALLVAAAESDEKRGSRVAGSPQTRHHLPGVIPATAALRVLTTAAGLRDPRTQRPLSEALLFAVAGGVGVGVCSFVYEKQDFASFFVAGRHGWHDDEVYLSEAITRLGLKATSHETAGAKAADAALRRALAEGLPCVAFLDMAMLPHRCLPAEFQGGGYHVITVYGIDDSRGVAWIGDLTDDAIEIASRDLAAARARIKKFKNRLMSIPSNAHPAPLTADLLADAVRAGLRACHAGLTGKPAKGYPNFFNLDAVRQWADRLHGSSGEQGWERLFPRGHRLWTALTSLHDYTENYGTGGGLCRPLFATALAEAAVLLNEPALRALSERYAALGREWTVLADAALPNDVPLFRQAREQFALRSELLTAGVSGPDAAAAREGVAQTWRRLAELRGTAREAFPLTEPECAELRRNLQSRVRAIHAAETEAHAELGRFLS